MAERPPDHEILRYEIIRKKKRKPDYYNTLANSLDYKQIKEMTFLAIQYKNLEAILGLLKSNVYAATDALNTEDGVKFFLKNLKNQALLCQKFTFLSGVQSLKNIKKYLGD